MFDPTLTLSSLSNLTLAQEEATVWGRLTETFNRGVEYIDVLNDPEKLLELLNSVPTYLAAGLTILGILCILNGYRWHRWVMIVSAFGVGFGVGYVLSKTMPQPYVIAGALALMAAVVANPLLRFTVAFFGGVTGAFVGANVWTAVGMPQETVLAGAAMGFILVGMASFMMYKHVIVLFTSVGGAALAVLGGFSLLLYVPQDQLNSLVSDSIRGNQILVPLLVLVAAVIGLVLQEKQKPEVDKASDG